ncbi:hypothetical protein C6P12_08250 [Weissella confusa]|uniref:hypothetical protein n=1 Tax=Weissella confusa TaxID=1583 RepID=UPI00107F15A3|nr:hypothetical protein [Weissella confusa]TGE64049.1 hypothetical protein C6P12_08250 [Weissella confusa]
MKLSNYQLLSIGNFLQSLTLPAQVSRARTKFIASLNEAIKELGNSERELVDENGGTVTETGAIEWPEGSNPAQYNADHAEMMHEVISIETNQVTLMEAFKNFFVSWDGTVAPEHAEAFDALYDALDINEDEQD